MESRDLANELVAFRPFEDTDLEAVFRLHNDLETKTLTLGWQLPVTREACRVWMADRAKAQDDATWAVVDNDSSFVGVVRVMDIERMSRRGEIGLYFSPDARGRGLGVATVRLACDWAFGFLGLHRITARILADNARALAVFDKCGFAREGLLRDEEYRLGRYHDVVQLGLLAPA